MSCLRSKVPVPCAKNPYLCGKLEKNINIATSISVHSIRMKKHQITVNILGCQKKETLPRLSIPSLFLCSSLLTWYCSLSWNKCWNFVADLIVLSLFQSHLFMPRIAREIMNHAKRPRRRLHFLGFDLSRSIFYFCAFVHEYRVIFKKVSFGGFSII